MDGYPEDSFFLKLIDMEEKRNYANLPRPLTMRRVNGKKVLVVTDFAPDVALTGPTTIDVEYDIVIQPPVKGVNGKVIPRLDIMLQIEEKYKRLEESQRISFYNIPDLSKNTKFNG